MTGILRATLATAFAAACVVGSNVALAANNGHNGNVGNDPGGHQTISRNSPDEMEKLDYGTTGTITTCDKKTSMQHANCGLPKLK